MESIDPITVSINSWIELVFSFLCHGDVAFLSLHELVPCLPASSLLGLLCSEVGEGRALMETVFLKNFPGFQI